MARPGRPGPGTGSNALAARRDYEEYLAWRDAVGDTAAFREMLARPMEVAFYEEAAAARPG